MSFKLRVLLVICICILVLFAGIKTSVLFEIIDSTRWTRGLEFSLLFILFPTLYFFVKGLVSQVNNNLEENERFIDKAALISKADAKGRITYVNKKFSEVSGWSLEEVVGKDHNIVNSGYHTKEFWKDMYKTVIKDKNVWNAICINRTKSGELYWVDTYIKGDFDADGKFIGFMSIRSILI